MGTSVILAHPLGFAPHDPPRSRPGHVERTAAGHSAPSAAGASLLLYPNARSAPAIPARGRDLAATRGQRSLPRDPSPPVMAAALPGGPVHRAPAARAGVSPRPAVARSGAGLRSFLAPAGSAP